jgi:hypothetical protein
MSTQFEIQALLKLAPPNAQTKSNQAIGENNAKNKQDIQTVLRNLLTIMNTLRRHRTGHRACRTPHILAIPAYNVTQTPEWVEIQADIDQLEADLLHCEAVLEAVTEHLKRDPDNKQLKQNFNAAWAAHRSAAKKVREENEQFCALCRAVMRSGDKR